MTNGNDATGVAVSDEIAETAVTTTCTHKAPLSDELAIKDITSSILAGRCVAFIGAGFAMPAIPGWKALLQALIEEDPDAKELHGLKAMLDGADAFRLEAIAQVIADYLGSGESLNDRLHKILSSDNIQLAHRVDMLAAIPFKAVVTTNFDGSLSGVRPDAKNLSTTIQARASVWTRVVDEQRTLRAGTSNRLGDKPGVNRSRVLKLHGQVGTTDNHAVLARRDYRRLVHGRHGYTPMLAALLATSDVLFLGTSFTDAYLNELRQQVVQWADESSSKDPPSCMACQMPVNWWAVMPNVPVPLQRSLTHSEGLQVISYEAPSKNRSAEPEDEHIEFTRFLEALHERASLAGLLRGRMEAAERLAQQAQPNKPPRTGILWFDPATDNNEIGERLLAKALGNNALRVVRDMTAMDRVLDEFHPLVVITRHGFQKNGGRSDAEMVLEKVRALGAGSPVIVFADATHADQNRWRLRAMGAVDYCHRWQDLFRVLGELLESDKEREERLDLR